MFLAEYLKTLLSASIAFDRSNVNGISPNPYTKERDNKSVRSRNAISFFCLAICLQANAIYSLCSCDILSLRSNAI